VHIAITGKKELNKYFSKNTVEQNFYFEKIFGFG